MSCLHSLLKSLRSDLLEVVTFALAVHICLDRSEFPEKPRDIAHSAGWKRPLSSDGVSYDGLEGRGGCAVWGVVGTCGGLRGEAGADQLHIDVMDGVFVPNLSFGAQAVKVAVGAIPLKVHLMMIKPGPYLDDFAKAGADTIYGGDGSSDPGVDGADEIRAGGGSDSVFGEGGDDTIYAEIGDDSVQGGDGDDSIYGAEGADTLYGNAGDDRLEGGIDDDTLHGGIGADVLLGGSGNDKLYGQDQDDDLDGGDGDERQRR